MSDKCKHNLEQCSMCHDLSGAILVEQPHPQADLLEKLSMLQEAVERNPEWWREIEYQEGDWWSCGNSSEAWEALDEGRSIRLKPHRVKVEGWVDAEIIQTAIIVRDTVGGNPGKVAQALLQLVGEKS